MASLATAALTAGIQHRNSSNTRSLAAAHSSQHIGGVQEHPGTAGAIWEDLRGGHEVPEHEQHAGAALVQQEGLRRLLQANPGERW